MTQDQAFAHMESVLTRWKHAAEDSRRNGQEYKEAANSADDAHLRRIQFEESSKFFGYAQEIQHDIDALRAVLKANKVKE